MTEIVSGQGRQNPARKIVFPLAAVLLSLLIVAAVLEAGLRLAGYSPANVNPLKAFHEYDPLTGHIGKKNYSGRFRRPEFDASVVHDSRGFRNRSTWPESGRTCPPSMSSGIRLSGAGASARVRSSPTS